MAMGGRTGKDLVQKGLDQNRDFTITALSFSLGVLNSQSFKK